MGLVPSIWDSSKVIQVFLMSELSYTKNGVTLLKANFLACPTKGLPAPGGAGPARVLDRAYKEAPARVGSLTVAPAWPVMGGRTGWCCTGAPGHSSTFCGVYPDAQLPLPFKSLCIRCAVCKFGSLAVEV